LKLAWNGWGALDNALVGGILLPLYGYGVGTGAMDGWVAGACLPFTGLTLVNLLATTWANRTADATVGNFALATRRSTLALKGFAARWPFDGFSRCLY